MLSMLHFIIYRNHPYCVFSIYTYIYIYLTLKCQFSPLTFIINTAVVAVAAAAIAASSIGCNEKSHRLNLIGAQKLCGAVLLALIYFHQLSASTCLTYTVRLHLIDVKLNQMQHRYHGSFAWTEWKM